MNAPADVIIGYHHNEERARELMTSLPAGGHAVPRLELENPDCFEVLASQTDLREAKLDILVNSAGFTRAIPHHDLAALT
ncbi:hypothetical protein ACE103_10915 [Bradyrhizobium sp. ma5]|uniref:hypothetical protein n=1 Tax=Bradyrhizobium sp. ma5 TaxID=3344828 RepID=UPI0035D4C982